MVPPMARSPRLTPVPPHLRLGGTAFLAIGLLLAAIGCGSNSERKVAIPTTAVRSTTTVEAPTSTTTPPTTEQQVKAAYLAAVATYFEVARDPNPVDPALAKTRSGPSLKRAQELLAGFQKAGTRVEYVHDQPPVPVVSSVRVTGADRASLTFCVVDNGRQVRASDGVALDDTIETRRSTADLRKSGGTWRIHSQTNLQTWNDAQGCNR